MSPIHSQAQARQYIVINDVLHEHSIGIKRVFVEDDAIRMFVYRADDRAPP